MLNLLNESELELASPEEQREYAALLQALELAQEQSQYTDLRSFAEQAWQVLEPGTPLVWNWHLDYLCEQLTQFRNGIIRRLILNVPPQTMKSRLASIFFPCWVWATEPHRRFICSSYSDSLSADLSVQRRKVMRSEWFQTTFPGKVEFEKDQNEKGEYANTAGGRMFATSTGSTATGKPSDFIIIDDPMNPQKAESEAERKTSNNFVDQTLMPRLSNQVTGCILIIMQRLHEDDTTGHVLSKEPGVWTHTRMPMEAEENEVWEFPISGRIVERSVKELLWAERFPKQVASSLKVSMGSRAYAGQYQQRPAPAEGAIIKRAWIQYYKQDPREKVKECDNVIASWDLTFKETKDSDFVVGGVWGTKGSYKILLDQVRDRMDFPTACNAVRSMKAKWPQITSHLIEDKANGPAVISSLRREISGLIPIEPQGSKEARLHAVSPEFESMCVWLPDPEFAPWVHDFVEEICSFAGEGTTKHDDQVDQTSQALNRLRMFPSGIASFYQEAAEAKQGVAA